MTRQPDQPRTLLDYLIRRSDRSYEEWAEVISQQDRRATISARHLRRLAHAERNAIVPTPATRRALRGAFGHPVENLLAPWIPDSGQASEGSGSRTNTGDIAERSDVVGTLRSPPTDDGWHVSRFTVLVRLDTPGVETYQDWRIVADRDGIDQITLGVTTPLTSTISAVSTPALCVEVRYGARLMHHEKPLPHRSQFALMLPRPLQAGQSHDCGITVRLDPGQSMRPHYVLTATRPYEQFTLRVRFDPDRLPCWVRRVNGEPVRTLDIVTPGTELLTVDAVGEIYTEFDQPTMYLAYGAQWQPAGSPIG